MNTLDAFPEQALAENQVDGIVITVYANERPLQGLAARIDWRLRGAVSRALSYGHLSAAPGEVTLLPIRKQDRIYRLLIVGAGDTDAPGARGPLPAQTVKKLRENLASLGKYRWAISHDDLGGETKSLTQPFPEKSGAELWVTR